MSRGGSGITITARNKPDNSNMRIFRAAGAGQNYSVLDTIAEDEYLDSEVDQDKDYKYKAVFELQLEDRSLLYEGDQIQYDGVDLSSWLLGKSKSTTKPGYTIAPIYNP